MFRLIVVLSIVGCSFGQFFNRGPHTAFNQFNAYNVNRFRTQPRYYTTPSPLPVVTARAEAEAVAQASPSPVPVAAPVYDGRYYNNYHRSNEENAAILRSTNDVNPDGNFEYSYETSNGIAAHAVGTPRNFGGNPPNVPTVIEGSYSYTAPDGTPVSISYVADEYGYRAVGDAIPTPPPIPKAILRALQYQGIRLDNNKK